MFVNQCQVIGVNSKELNQKKLETHDKNIIYYRY